MTDTDRRTFVTGAALAGVAAAVPAAAQTGGGAAAPTSAAAAAHPKPPFRCSASPGPALRPR
ncbi:hypothetical protein ACVOMT_01525 [Sphingomonas panni]